MPKGQGTAGALSRVGGAGEPYCLSVPRTPCDPCLLQLQPLAKAALTQGLHLARACSSPSHPTKVALGLALPRDFPGLGPL